MHVQENGSSRIIISGSMGSTGYGCGIELAEVNFKSIAKLLYFKIRYEIKERLKKWESSENLLRISSMIKNISGWKLS